MAVDMFLKIDTITADSNDSVHSGEIDVLAWSWGSSNSGDAQRATGAGAGKSSVGDISITKWVDSSTTSLWQAVCNGTHYDTATLTVRKSGGKEPVEYVVIKMGVVFITSHSTGGSGGSDALTENITLNFANVTLNYTPQAADGTAGATQTVSWDMTKNAPVS